MKDIAIALFLVGAMAAGAWLIIEGHDGGWILIAAAFWIVIIGSES